MTQCTSPPALAIYNMNFSPSSKVLPKEEDTTDEVEALPQCVNAKLKCPHLEQS